MQGSLFASADHGHQGTLQPCAAPGAVAAPDFAIHHRRTDRLFARWFVASIVGSIRNQNQCIA